jgi:hypothetical protein
LLGIDLMMFRHLARIAASATVQAIVFVKGTQGKYL